MSKFKTGTVEKDSSLATGPPAGIKPAPFQCWCNALSLSYKSTKKISTVENVWKSEKQIIN